MTTWSTLTVTAADGETADTIMGALNDYLDDIPYTKHRKISSSTVAAKIGGRDKCDTCKRFLETHPDLVERGAIIGVNNTSCRGASFMMSTQTGAWMISRPRVGPTQNGA